MTIKEIIESIANREIEKYHCNGICPRYFEDICEINNWEFDLDPNDYNGWQVDWSATIIIDGTKVVNVFGTMYNGTADLYLSNG